MSSFIRPEILRLPAPSDGPYSIGETIRVRLKPRPLMLDSWYLDPNITTHTTGTFTADKLIREPPFPFASLDRVTSGRERSTE